MGFSNSIRDSCAAFRVMIRRAGRSRKGGVVTGADLGGCNQSVVCQKGLQRALGLQVFLIGHDGGRPQAQPVTDWCPSWEVLLNVAVARYKASPWNMLNSLGLIEGNKKSPAFCAGPISRSHIPEWSSWGEVDRSCRHRFVGGDTMTTREVKPKFPPAPVNWFQLHRTGWYETRRRRRCSIL